MTRLGPRLGQDESYSATRSDCVCVCVCRARASCRQQACQGRTRAWLLCMREGLVNSARARMSADLVDDVRSRWMPSPRLARSHLR